MNTVIFGGAGFIGLNLAQHLLDHGHAVTIFDRRSPHDAAMAAFRGRPGKLTIVGGDVLDAEAVRAAIVPGTEVVVMGAAITSGPDRDASDPATILSVNVMAQIPILQAARDAGVRRVINLSSAAAYGKAGDRVAVLDEKVPVDPVGLYPITKWASERIGSRLGALWGLDVVSARLSGIFGPWEHDTGVRDTPSPHFQVLSVLEQGRPALLPRSGTRDWTYAVDIAEALATMARAPSLSHPVYNLSAETAWSVLEWGQIVARNLGDGVCRLTAAGETPTIDLYAPVDRAPMSASLFEAETGWRARFGMQSAADDLVRWHRARGGAIKRNAAP